jgi:hypothetical protein
VSRTLAQKCPQCKSYASINWGPHLKLSCPKCSHTWGETSQNKDAFDKCPACGCRQFYLSKDFNQLLGCLIMLTGIVLVPWTYGLSLPVFALVDWILHKRVAALLNCYRCGLEFHGFKDEEKRFKPFMHHIGLKYDKYR